jgi:hypothetical protein
MLLSTEYLRNRGWRSAGVVQNAKRELMDARFIFETVKGRRPSKTSWYAVTSRQLDALSGYGLRFCVCAALWLAYAPWFRFQVKGSDTSMDTDPTLEEQP